MSVKIALAGNPNCGKTTLFNALTGSNQFVGNWPGVTVEKKEGKLKGNKDVTITDLPGIYSLSPYTLKNRMPSLISLMVRILKETYICPHRSWSWVFRLLWLSTWLTCLRETELP